MKQVIISIIVIIFSIGCKKEIASVRPQPLIYQDTLYPDDYSKYTFLVNPELQWSTSIQTFRQTYLIKNEIIDSILSLHISLEETFNEGSAYLILNDGISNYFYPLVLKNNYKRTKWKKFDFRSPKTVNTDSTLQHQSLIYYLDTLQNILLSDTSSYFPFKKISLNTLTEKKQALAFQNLSTYYVNPGNAISIELQYIKNLIKNKYTISTLPLKDKYNNIVTDGTLLTFTILQNKKTIIQEVQTQNGIAQIEVPIDAKANTSITAHTATTISNTLHLSL